MLRLEDHAGEAYVSFGRMNVLNMLESSGVGTPRDLRRRNMYNLKDVEDTMVETCRSQLSLSSMMTPRILADFTTSRMWSPMVRAGGWVGVVARSKCITTVFLLLRVT